MNYKGKHYYPHTWAKFMQIEFNRNDSYDQVTKKSLNNEPYYRFFISRYQEDKADQLIAWLMMLSHPYQPHGYKSLDERIWLDLPAYAPCHPLDIYAQTREVFGNTTNSESLMGMKQYHELELLKTLKPIN